MQAEQNFMKQAFRRKRRQSGHEIMEFALSAILLIPIFLGMFNVGMNLIRSIEVQSVTRDLDDLYIHGADFSSYSYQLLAQTLATGMNLQFPAFTGTPTNTNQASNLGTTGDGIVWVSQVEWIGGTTAPNCVAVGASNCTNTNSFVFTQRIVFGNSSLTSQKTSNLGTPTGETLSTSGEVANPVTDATAQLPSAGQTYMQSLWQTSANGQQSLIDGQTIYVVECFFQTPNISISSTGGKVYAIYFF
jgi:hypothetical protein